MNNEIFKKDNNDFFVKKKSLKDVYKSEIYNEFKPKPIRLIRNLIVELVREHNKNNKNQLSLKAHTVPYFIYNKVVDFYSDN